MPDFEPIHIVGVIEGDVGIPKGHGPGAGLYNVPLRLSAEAPSQWGEIFREELNNPPAISMEVSVSGDRAVVYKTTIERIKENKGTLEQAANRANVEYKKQLAGEMESQEAETSRVDQHRENVAEVVDQIKFTKHDE